MPTSRVPGSGFVIYHCPETLHSPTEPPLVYLNIPAEPIICLHCHVLWWVSASIVNACQQPVCSQWGLALAAAQVPTTMCVYNQPVPLHRHLQLAPATKYVHTTGSRHHGCWFLSAGPKTLETPIDLADTANQPTVLNKDHRVASAANLSAWTKETSCLLRPSATTYACA